MPRRTKTQISGATPLRVRVGPHNWYQLERAAIGTDFGEPDQPKDVPEQYAFPMKKAEKVQPVWLVRGDRGDGVRGVLQQIRDYWVFSHILGHKKVSPRFVSRHAVPPGATIYRLSLREDVEGPTAAEAIAAGLGIRLPVGEPPIVASLAPKTSRQIRREVDQILAGESSQSIRARELKAEARALQALGAAAPKRRVQELDRQLRSVLGDIDPFWVRWSAFVEGEGGGRVGPSWTT